VARHSFCRAPPIESDTSRLTETRTSASAVRAIGYQPDDPIELATRSERSARYALARLVRVYAWVDSENETRRRGGGEKRFSWRKSSDTPCQLDARNCGISKKKSLSEDDGLGCAPATVTTKRTALTHGLFVDQIETTAHARQLEHGLEQKILD